METDKSGRLKIFFSYAEGTGKIGQMLRDAAEMKKEGCDVVVGCVPLELDLGEKMEKLAPVFHNYQGNLSPEFDLGQRDQKKARAFGHRQAGPRECSGFQAQKALSGHRGASSGRD